MKIKYLSISIVLFLTMSCGGGENSDNGNEIISIEEQRNEMFQEVIKVHDDVMPKMEDIIGLQDQIRIMMDSLLEVDSTSVELSNLKEMNFKLNAADKSMMNWMREFDVEMNSDEVNQDEAIEYFTNEMNKIKEVKVIVDTNIEEVAKALAEN